MHKKRVQVTHALESARLVYSTAYTDAVYRLRMMGSNGHPDIQTFKDRSNIHLSIILDFQHALIQKCQTVKKRPKTVTLSDPILTILQSTLDSYSDRTIMYSDKRIVEKLL